MKISKKQRKLSKLDVLDELIINLCLKSLGKETLKSDREILKNQISFHFVKIMTLLSKKITEKTFKRKHFIGNILEKL